MMNRQRNPGAWRGGEMESGQAYQGRMPEEAAVVTVARGSMLVQMDGYSRVMGSGEMFLLPPGATYEYRAREAVKVVACCFLPEMLPGILPVRELVCHCRGNAGGIATLKAGRAFRHFFLLSDYYQINGLFNEQMQETKCREFFCLMQGIYNKVELAGFLRPVMDERTWFRSFVSGNWMKARSVDELAAIANMSTSGFMKKFRRHFGEPPYKWMTGRKAECVLAEINSGGVPLKEIVDRYNFVNYAHFWTFCRKQYGLSPKELQGKVSGDVLQKPEPEKAG